MIIKKFNSKPIPKVKKYILFYCSMHLKLHKIYKQDIFIGYLA